MGCNVDAGSFSNGKPMRTIVYSARSHGIHRRGPCVVVAGDFRRQTIRGTSTAERAPTYIVAHQCGSCEDDDVERIGSWCEQHLVSIRYALNRAAEPPEIAQQPHAILSPHLPRASGTTSMNQRGSG